MTKKSNLKTKSLYIGLYEDENGNGINWLTFIYNSNAGDEKLSKQFRLVYKSEHGLKIDPLTHVDIYELHQCYDYTAKKYYTISLSSCKASK